MQRNSTSGDGVDRRLKRAIPVMELRGRWGFVRVYRYCDRHSGANRRRSLASLVLYFCWSAAQGKLGCPQDHPRMVWLSTGVRVDLFDRHLMTRNHRSVV
jgi:hypothetical protein